MSWVNFGIYIPTNIHNNNTDNNYVVYIHTHIYTHKLIYIYIIYEYLYKGCYTYLYNTPRTQ